jgi:hypothetical protein
LSHLKLKVWSKSERIGLLPGQLNFKMNPIRDLNWDEKKGRIEENSIHQFNPYSLRDERSFNY